MTLDGLIDRLRLARHAAIFTHLRPDPDAMGSQAAAAWILSALGTKRIELIQFAEAPAPYRFLQEDLPATVALWDESWCSGPGADVDTIVLVDTCTYQQLEPAKDYLKAHHDRVLAIDHHLSRDDIGPTEYLYTDSHAAACVEILWQIARQSGVTVDASLAMPLMAGLVGDTGWFRFDSVTPRTHAMAADLVRHVNPSTLYERLMQNETRSKLALMERALLSLRWSADERFACMMLTQADFTQSGATHSQTEYLVDMPMIVRSVEVVALMSQQEDDRIRVSLRSKHGVDVNRICRGFGGGGHAKAAGCRLDGTLDEAYGRLCAAVESALA